MKKKTKIFAIYSHNDNDNDNNNNSDHWQPCYMPQDFPIYT